MFQDTSIPLRSEVSSGHTFPAIRGPIALPQTSLIQDHIHLKIGRAVNLTKRLDQWAKQCGTKEREHIIRGWWPGTVDHSGDAAVGGSHLKGKVVAGEKGAYCHRLERLIHLELGDLVLSQQYLDPAFPKIDTSNVKKTGVSAKQKCTECRSPVV
jgi:hypothetical protein